METWEYDELTAKITLAIQMIQDKGIMNLTEQDRALLGQISNGLIQSKIAQDNEDQLL